MLDGALDGLDDRGARRARRAFRARHGGAHHRADLPVLALRPARADHSRHRSQARSGRASTAWSRSGPHGSATPRAVLAKLPVDLVVMGEAEEVVQALAGGADPAATPGVVRRRRPPALPAVPQAGRFVDLPALVLAGRMDPRAPSPPPPLRARPRRPRRRGRGLARLPLQLQLLRQAALSRPLPPSPARPRARGDRSADRAGRDLPLLRRRDLPAAARAAGGAGRAPGRVRRADPDRPVEARAARAARRRGLRLDRGGRRERHRAGPRDARQETVA